jgi:hypothetical protein
LQEAVLSENSLLLVTGRYRCPFNGRVVADGSVMHVRPEEKSIAVDFPYDAVTGRL